MIYFVFTDATRTVIDRILTGDNAYQDVQTMWDRVESNNEFKHTWERVVELAHQATQLADNDTFLPVDRGSHTSPRFSVVVAPKVGEKVSRGFNGDYYPAGEIVKISKSFRRVETSTGVVFWRRVRTATWSNEGTWSMVNGHINRLSPEY